MQLVLDSVTKRYVIDGKPFDAVREASLRVQAGDFISIVGHSGSGKTTLLSMIGGIVEPSAGRIAFEGSDLYGLDSDALSRYRAEKVGFMFQFASLLPMLTVRENLLLPTAFRAGGSGNDAESADRKAGRLIEMVGLQEKLNAYPAQLSGGQQRRVAIARAFMNDPAVILADEPTGDLDEETERDMMNFFLTMNQRSGTTFLLVTHNSELAKQASRRLRMQRGVLEELA